MLRFSDRLSSTSSTTLDQVKATGGVNGTSDEVASGSPSEQEYTILVELIGLHQTVKILEAEYNLVLGGDGKLDKDYDIKSGYYSSQFNC